MFGYDLLDTPARFARFEEGLEVITRLLRSADPVTFEGDYYRLQDAVLLPRSQRPGGPPVLIGGNGETRTLPLVARFANEWNGVFLPPARYAELSGKLDNLLRAEGRQPQEVRRSLMTGLIFGRTQAELEQKLAGWATVEQTRGALRARGMVVGVGEEVAEQLAKLAEAGLQRVMLQWLDLDDIAGLEALARVVL
jgi:alkanesulfonate monooxygenase SsuD/methylene tetrahydromethanopterin reductase-like flavin-dependent oxidoreductase (luciferase family)